MEKIDRKTLVLLIGGIIAIVAVTVALLLPTMLRGGEEVVPAPSETPASETPPAEEPAPTSIVTPDDEGAAPGIVYENDYSSDIGYTPLPDDASASDVPEGTILDQSWANEKLVQLACELSAKDVVEERALQPLEAFYTDLPLAGDAWGNGANSALRDNIRFWLSEYRQAGEGSRAPGETRALLDGYCHSSSHDDSGLDGGDIPEGPEEEPTE